MNDPGGPYIPILTAFYDGFLKIGSRGRLGLQQDLARLLMGEDLPLYPLERIIDRLGVAG